MSIRPLLQLLTLPLLSGSLAALALRESHLSPSPTAQIRPHSSPARPPFQTPWRLYVYTIASTIVGGIFVVTFVLPTVSGYVGDFFFTPGGRAKLGPFEKAMHLLTSGRTDAAVAAFTALMSGPEKDRRAVVELARLHEKELSTISDAVRIYERAMKEPWPPADLAHLLLQAGNMCTKGGLLTRARHFYTRLVTECPQTPDAATAHRLLAQLSTPQGLRPPHS